MSGESQATREKELTLFSTCKPFRGQNAVIQRNALASWRQLGAGCDVIIFGDEYGADKMAANLGFTHVPEVECNEHGTPLIGTMFNAARAMARTPYLCYVNADIILFGDFLRALRRVNYASFLMIGQRWDFGIGESLDYTLPDWDERLLSRLRIDGKLHAVTGIDYFVFSRDLYGSFPPFVIGRGGWDNWLIYQARKEGVPVIDATPSVTIIHQNHDYGHITGAPIQGWKGVESERNLELMGGLTHAFTLENATHLLTPGGIRPARRPRHLYFRLRALPVLHPGAGLFLHLFRLFERLVKLGRRVAKRSPSAKN